MSIKTVFMGSPDFAVKILSSLAEHFEVCGVVTQPDRPAGRGKVITPPPVKCLAEELKIPVMQPERLKNPEAMAQLAGWNPDLIVVAAFGQILRQNVLDLPRFGCINVHASYLPRWRGAAPIQAAILAGDAFSGITIMKMDAGIDTGPVLAQERVDLTETETLESLTTKLAQTGSELLIDTLNKYLTGEIQPVIQPEEGATYASMLKKEDGLLNFSESTLVIDRKVRALNDWPGTYWFFDGQPIKIRKVLPILSQSHNYGELTVLDKWPAISTPDGWIKLVEVQPAGKKWMSGLDFLRGIKNWGTHG